MDQPTRPLAAALCALALSVPAAAQAPVAPSGAPATAPAVRPTGPRATHTLGWALERSSIVRELVAQLEKSDVVVYVSVRHRTCGPAARIRLVGATPAGRFLAVDLRADFSTSQLVALLGHELQHALEIAEAPGVRDAASFDAFYRRGLQRPGLQWYDTLAARRAGEQVKQELARGGGR